MRSRSGDLRNWLTLSGERLLTRGAQALSGADRKVTHTFVQAALDLIGGLEFFAVSHDVVCR
jgi:hypothetical protein